MLLRRRRRNLWPWQHGAMRKFDGSKSVVRNRCTPVEKKFSHWPVEFDVKVNSNQFSYYIILYLFLIWTEHFTNDQQSKEMALDIKIGDFNFDDSVKRWIFWKYGGRMWTGFVYLRLRVSDHGIGPSGLGISWLAERSARTTKALFYLYLQVGNTSFNIIGLLTCCHPILSRDTLLLGPALLREATDIQRADARTDTSRALRPGTDC